MSTAGRFLDNKVSGKNETEEKGRISTVLLSSVHPRPQFSHLSVSAVHAQRAPVAASARLAPRPQRALAPRDQLNLSREQGCSAAMESFNLRIEI